MKKMKKETVLKIIGLAASIMGLGASLLSDWVSDQKLDAKIDERLQLKGLA